MCLSSFQPALASASLKNLCAHVCMNAPFGNNVLVVFFYTQFNYPRLTFSSSTFFLSPCILCFKSEQLLLRNNKCLLAYFPLRYHTVRNIRLTLVTLVSHGCSQAQRKYLLAMTQLQLKDEPLYKTF